MQYLNESEIVFFLFQISSKRRTTKSSFCQNLLFQNSFDAKYKYFETKWCQSCLVLKAFEKWSVCKIPNPLHKIEHSKNTEPSLRSIAFKHKQKKVHALANQKIGSFLAHQVLLRRICQWVFSDRKTAERISWFARRQNLISVNLYLESSLFCDLSIHFLPVWNICLD